MPYFALLTSGTRGDVQPYIALGVGLQAAGQTVRLIAPPAFQGLVEQHGLPFAPLHGNPSDLMVQAETKALTYDGGLWRSLRASWDFWRAARPVYAQMLASAAAATTGAEVLLCGLPTIWGTHLAEARQIPLIWAFLQPLTPTRTFPSPLLPTRWSAGGAYNHLTHRLVEQAVWWPWRSVINAFRRTQLGLPPAPLWHPTLKKYPALYGYSPHVAPRPADWPPHHQLTGYWNLPPTPWQPPPELAHFLAQPGDPVVSLSFGSPGWQQVQPLLAQLENTLAAAHARAVFIAPRPWPTPLRPSSRLFLIEAVPHDWLFSRVAAAAHHGGAGTTAASLHAGLPTLLLPLTIDQFFWAERVAALGVGPRPIPQRALTAEKFGAALHEALTATPMHTQAQRLRQALLAEDGVAAALTQLRSFFKVNGENAP